MGRARSGQIHELRAMSQTRDRSFFVENLNSACVLLQPKTVLEVGAPQDVQIARSLYACATVHTCDPFVAGVDYPVKFEDFSGPKYDLVNMTSVLDYLEDPVAGIRKAGVYGASVLVQGRLNTYESQTFKTKWWTPTADCVKSQFPEYLPDHDVVWCRFFGYQVFSLLWRAHAR